MTDLSEIKAGDKLRVELLITRWEDNGAGGYSMGASAGGMEEGLYIPYQWILGKDCCGQCVPETLTGGIVLKFKDEYAVVSWPHGPIEDFHADDLELDAPGGAA